MKAALAGMLLAIGLAGCARGSADDGAIILPAGLREVSDLAVAGQSSVFAHNDTHAIIYEIDVDTRRILRAFAMGDPTIQGDFEGIAHVDGKVFLLTSDGRLYSATPAPHRQRVTPRVYDIGIDRICDVEGLSAAPTPGDLLVLCNRFHRKHDRQRLEIYRWPIGAARVEAEPWLSVPLVRILRKDEIAGFRPSALAWDAPRGRLIILSGHNRVFLAIDRAGKLLERRRLDPRRHGKAEGVAILPPCRLALANEGSRKRKGTITIDPCP